MFNKFFHLKKVLSFAVTLLISSVSPLVGEGCSELTLGFGWRTDDLNWNIAGVADSPNVISELEWKQLRLWLASAEFYKICSNSVTYRLQANYGKIFHGSVRDSDYGGNDRTDEFSRSICDAGRGEVFDLSGAVGYAFCFCDGGVVVTPLAGYSHNEQHLRMFDGFQVVDTETDFYGPIDGLHSNYRGRWYGPWLGLDVIWRPWSCIEFFTTFEYHWANYHGSGHWNLREEFVNDFKHTADAIGTHGRVGLTYRPCGNWSFSLTGSYRDMHTHSGRHKVKLLVDLLDEDEQFVGTVPVSVSTRLNRVNWRALAITGSVGYLF